MHLFEEVIKLMNHVEKMKNKTGNEKKQYVLDQLRNMYPVSYQQYRPFLDMMIDGIVKISKRDIKLALNKLSILSKICCK